MAEASVVRLHLRSLLEHVDHREQERFCLNQGWAGVGWGIWDRTASGISWDEYRERKIRDDGGVNDSVRRLHDLAVGTLVWTRRLDGSYWLGELTGRWEYRGDETARGLDLFNVRPSRWWSVGTEDAVPGKIINNFRATVTVNAVADPGAVRYTRRLHAQVAGHRERLEPLESREIIESMLGPEALEDLVAVFLQDQFDLLLVARGRSTPGYEYVLRHRRTGRRAVCSVKSGATPVQLERLPEDPAVDTFAYAVCGAYLGEPPQGLRTIATEELVGFVETRREVLPDQVARWLAA